MTTSTITTGIEAVIASVLSTYRQLEFGTDPTDNKFKANFLGFSVEPGEFRQLGGATAYFTVSQRFTVKLAKSFGQSKVGDAAQRANAKVLYDDMFTLTKQIYKGKANGTAIIVADVETGEVEYFDSNLAVLSSTMTIQFRVAL